MRDASIDAVLFDRDGTLVHDVPYNDDPDLVQPIAGAREALLKRCAARAVAPTSAPCAAAMSWNGSHVPFAAGAASRV